MVRPSGRADLVDTAKMPEFARRIGFPSNESRGLPACVGSQGLRHGRVVAKSDSPVNCGCIETSFLSGHIRAEQAIQLGSIYKLP